MKKLLLTTMVCMAVLSGSAQDDTGMWMSASVTKKLSSKWSADAEIEYRMRDNISQTDRMSVGLGVGYKLMKGIKIGADYTLIEDYKDAGNTVALLDFSDNASQYNVPSYTYWQQRHRFNMSVTGSLKLSKRWDVSLRERWQYTYRPSEDIYGTYNGQRRVIKTVDGKGENILRSRLTVSYDIKKSPIQPYVSCEVFTTDRIEKMRYMAGAEYDITKQHSVKLYYMYQKETGNDGNSLQAIGIDYGYKF